MCAMFLGDGLVSICLNAAAFNLVMIALERYVKIVHPVKHRSHFQKCVGYHMCFVYFSQLLLASHICPTGDGCNIFTFFLSSCPTRSAILKYHVTTFEVIKMSNSYNNLTSITQQRYDVYDLSMRC